MGLYWKAVASPIHPVEGDLEGWEFRLTPLKHHDVTRRKIEYIDAYEDLTDQILFEDMRMCREAELRIHFVGGERLEFHYMGGDLKIKLIECSST